LTEQSSKMRVSIEKSVKVRVSTEQSTKNMSFDQVISVLNEQSIIN
jgi:hypothetical protein